MIDSAVSAIRAGKVVIIPTDTVYGLCASPYTAEPVRKLSRLKGRDESQPIALLASDVEFLFECVPELRGRAGTIARALLPGPYTLVLPNPTHRFRWLCGTTPEAIGVRIPDLPAASKAVVERTGVVAATSANLHGGPDPARLQDVPPEILDGCGAVLDAGELPGTPSTVVDLTGPDPVVLREGAVSAEEALKAASAALSRR